MRQDRKRNHERIQQAAIQLITEKGMEAVSFEEVAKSAEVSRGTLYNHYHSFDDVIIALTVPVLQAGIDYYKNLLDESISLDKLLGVFTMMWKNHGDALRLIECTKAGELKQLKDLHSQFVQLFRKAIARVEQSQNLPLGIALSGTLISNLFLPVLTTLETEQNWESKFINIMKGALLHE